MDIENKEKSKKKENIWNKVFNKRKLSKPEKAAVLYLRRNNNAQGFEVPTKKGFFTIEGNTYHTQRDCQFKLGKEGLPLLIIEEEGLIPRGNHDFYESLKDLKNFEYKNAEYQDLVLKAIRHAELVRAEGKDGPKLNTKVAIGLAIAAIIGYAVLKGYGG